MPLVSEMVHPRGLDFANQRKVVILRDVKDMAWDDIADQVVMGPLCLPGASLERQIQ